MQTLTDRFEVLRSHLAAQAEQLCSPPMPLPLNTTVFVVIVAVFEVPLRIASTACHSSNGQHNPTVTLFENWMQIFKP
jgi:hypothetical protein